MATCLISQDDENLVVHQDAVAQLAALGSTPIAPIAVAGLYRTGKSFLLTQLGLEAGRTSTDKTFVVGSTTESCTRGIWMWIAPEGSWKCHSDPTARLVLLDTEGLASFDQDETYDAKIFSLGILLSAMFIYNRCTLACIFVARSPPQRNIGAPALDSRSKCCCCRTSAAWA